MQYYGEYEEEYEIFLIPKEYVFHFIMKPMFNIKHNTVLRDPNYL